MTTSQESVEELLPFLVNGTLDGAEHDRVARAVDADPALAHEVSALRAVRDRMRSESPAQSPGEFGLARLMRDIDAAGSTPVARRQTALPWLVAIAAVLALVAVLATGTIAPQPDGAIYEQASGDAGDAALTVAFRPDATQGDIATLLQDNGLIIVDGPSALGLYRLAALDGADLAALSETLRARGELVESVDVRQ